MSFPSEACRSWTKRRTVQWFSRPLHPPPITANSRICLVRILTIRHRHPSSFETINHHQQQQQQLSWIFSPSNKISLKIPFKKVSNITKSTTTWWTKSQHCGAKFPISSYVARDPKSSRWKCHVALRRPPGASSCAGGKPFVETKVLFFLVGVNQNGKDVKLVGACSACSVLQQKHWRYMLIMWKGNGPHPHTCFVENTTYEGSFFDQDVASSFKYEHMNTNLDT